MFKFEIDSWRESSGNEVGAKYVVCVLSGPKFTKRFPNFKL